jgi:hypothetical protein
MGRMKTPAEILGNALDPFNDPDNAPKLDSVRRESIEARLSRGLPGGRPRQTGAAKLR